MRIVHHLAAAAAAASLGLAGASDEAIDMTPASRAAHAWLETVDAGRYGESWEQASTLFREAIPRLRWETTVQSVREPLGIVGVRKVRSMTYARVLPGAPEGEYVVIQFDTRFENRPLSVETVTPMREKDGTWKVSGYFIR
jgi:hypothetical protein